MADTLILRAAGHNQGARLVDHGRPGLRDQGIPSGGPADRRSCRKANELLAQAAGHCSLELALYGGRWLLSGKGQFVLTGAEMDWKLNATPVGMHSVIYLDGDYLLTGGYARGNGCRAYLAIRGAWQLPRILGSVELGLPGTTHIESGFWCPIVSTTEGAFRNGLLPEVGSVAEAALAISVVAAPEWRLLSSGLRDWLLHSTFRVHPDSDRQGIRLQASDQPPGELAPLLSSPVLPGTVQLTPAGPILLGPDAQTVGGYPRVLLSQTYDRAFQLRPGQCLRFLLRTKD